MGKRAAASANNAAHKKIKVKPVFVEIQDALQKAEHLPESVRTMLASMVPSTFSNGREERSEHQNTVSTWIEDALEKQKGKFVGEVDIVAAKLAGLETSKAEHVSEAQKAEATLADRRKVVTVKKTALAEATIALNATKKDLAEKQEEQRACDADYVEMKKEQEGLAAAFVEHFQVPLNAGEALHYESLQPFLRNLDLEESFMVSAPSSCKKTKAERGSFDNVVVEALQQALFDRASQIKDVVSNRSPESIAREAGVQKAEEQLAQDKASQETAAADLAAAQKEVEVSSATLKEKEKLVESWDVDIKATTDVCEKLRCIRESFEKGPMASFKTCRDGTAQETCAVAGA